MSEPTLLALSRQLEHLAQTAAAAVVGIQSHSRPEASGFIWGPGVVVTASDALEADDGITVLAAGKSLAAQLAGRDPSTDIAVLRVTDSPPEPARLSPSGEARVGQMVLAVGRGADGIIANLGMVSIAGGAWQSRRGGSIDSLIRLDMRLQPLSEGGIVVDGEGRLLGMPVLGPRQRPLVIPISTIERVAPRLLAEGRIQRGYLGVGLHPIRLDEALATVHALSDRRASVVVSVDPAGPARKAGILVGDVIVELDGETVPGPRGLLAQLTPESVGKEMEFKVLRAGQIATARVTIGTNPAP